MFDIDKDVKVLQQFVKVSKFDKNGCKMEPAVAVKHHTFNYSDIYFLTRHYTKRRIYDLDL